jgi:hypothetical protein
MFVTSVTSRDHCRIVVSSSWKPKNRFVDATKLNWLQLQLSIGATTQMDLLVWLIEPTMPLVKLSWKIHAPCSMQS